MVHKTKVREIWIFPSDIEVLRKTGSVTWTGGNPIIKAIYKSKRKGKLWVDE